VPLIGQLTLRQLNATLYDERGGRFRAGEPSSIPRFANRASAPTMRRVIVVVVVIVIVIAAQETARPLTG